MFILCGNWKEAGRFKKKIESFSIEFLGLYQPYVRNTYLMCPMHKKMDRITRVWDFYWTCFEFFSCFLFFRFLHTFFSCCCWNDDKSGDEKKKILTATPTRIWKFSPIKIFCYCIDIIWESCLWIFFFWLGTYASTRSFKRDRKNKSETARFIITILSISFFFRLEYMYWMCVSPVPIHLSKVPKEKKIVITM